MNFSLCVACIVLLNHIVNVINIYREKGELEGCEQERATVPARPITLIQIVHHWDANKWRPSYTEQNVFRTRYLL